MAKTDIGGVWRTVGGRRIFIKDGQNLASAMKESGKFKKYNSNLENVFKIINQYGPDSEKVQEAIKKRDKEFQKIFKNKEEENTYFNIRKIVKSEDIPSKVKDEILKFKIINASPYSDSFYDSNNITWNSKPEGSIRISDHWNFQSQGSIHCKLKGINEYIVGWKMARYENGEYIIIKEFD